MHIDAILISILKYCFASLLSYMKSGVLRSPIPPVASFRWSTHLGVLATQLGISPRVKAPNPDREGGGGGLGSPLAGFPPNTTN